MTDVKVEQCDRILFSFLLGWDVTDNRQRILDGHFDQHVKMQKIARHRQAAEKAQQERDAGIVKSREQADDFNEAYIEGWNDACDNIATAIRSQGHE